MLNSYDPSTAGLFDVSAAHSYASAGTDSFTVTVSDGSTSAAIVGTADVTNPPLAALPVTVSAQAGVAATLTLATFTALPSDSSGDFTATINWGDGSAVTAGSIAAVSGSPGSFTVSGAHAYASEGGDTITVTLNQTGGDTATVLDTANISGMDPTADTISAVEGATFTGTLVTFTDTDSGVTAGGFTAAINWGDGQTSIGVITGDPYVSGQFDVGGTHLYTQAGSFPFTVSILDAKGHTALASGTAAVSVATMTVANAYLWSTAGLPFTGAVAIITDSNLDSTAGDFTATVNWGDGSATSTATIVPVAGEPGEFDVFGAHTYAVPGGWYYVTVQVTDQGGATETVTSDAQTSPATLVGTFIAPSFSTGVCSTVTVASFSEGSDVAPGDFTATIDWGDGTDPTIGTITAPSGPGQPLGVTGSHEYASDGVYTVTITISDVYGDGITLTGSAEVTDVTGTGASISAVEGYTYSGAVATFTDSNTSDDAASYSAVVNWGDGDSTVGTVTEGALGSYSVSSNYTYEAAGSYATSVTLLGADGVQTTITGLATVADSPVVVTGAAFDATAGQTSTVTVARFTKGGNYVAGDFEATINWGDGTTSAGTIIAPSPADPNYYTVTGSHKYLSEGNENATVTVTEIDNGDAASGTGAATVTDMDPTAASLSIQEGDSLGGSTLATFTDTQAGVTVSSFTVSIQWGDGQTSTGTVSPYYDEFTVADPHVYALAGSYIDVITITDASGHVVSVSGTVTVTDVTTFASASSFSSTAGTAYSGTVATFTTPADVLLTAADFTTTINWGDGDTTVGTVTATGSGAFKVVGSHVYVAGGSMPVSVTITDHVGVTATVSETANVADASFSASAPAISATTGNEFSGLIATFTFDPGDAATDFNAVIDWGDGSTTSTGTVTAPNTPTGVFQVSGQHTYATAGSDTISVTITYTSASGSTATASASGTATVSNLAVASQTVQATESEMFEGTVATFADVSTSSLVGASATITWGDGTASSAGVIEPDPFSPGLYDVEGSHVYAAAGTDTITIEVTDDGDTSSGTSTAEVTDAPITVTSGSVSPTAGEPFTGVVATFTDADTTKTAGDFTATINWGDGDTSTATISADTSIANQFDVTGTQTYSEAGSYDLTIDVQDADGASASANGTAATADAPLTGLAQSITGTAGAQYAGVVAIFLDPNAAAVPADFTATINWGDGGTSTATISVAGNDGFYVSGSYTYQQYGTYQVTVQVTSAGGSTVTINSTAGIADAPLTQTTNTDPPQPTAGAAFEGTLAQFTDANSYATAAQFTATITWGDGSSSAGTVSTNGAGGFEVDGTHAYEAAGLEDTSVAIVSAGGSTKTITGLISVADATISASGTTVTIGQGQSFNGEIATFTDANPYATYSSVLNNPVEIALYEYRA